MGTAHARLGPSNHRWVHCPGSVRVEANYPDVAGSAAIDGTGSHELLELCLKNNVRAESYDGQIICVNHPDNMGGWLVDVDRCKRVQMCLDYIHARVTELKKIYSNVSVSSETKSDPGGMFGRDDWWGTVDITIICKNSQAQVLFIEVCDYKDGRGYVHAQDNSQLISYMAGKLRPYISSGPEQVSPLHPSRVPNVRMSIVQPKTNPVVRYQDTSAKYVIDKAEELALAAYRTDKPDAPLIPDDRGGKGYCQWCKHKKNCSAQSEQSLEVMKDMTTTIENTGKVSLFELVAESAENPTTLDSDKLAQLADAEAGIQAIFDKAKKEIQDRIERGETVPGFGMVNGRGSKSWALDEEEMIKKFRARKLTQDEYAPRKLASPAQILKLDKLTKKQKEAIEEELVIVKAGPKKLGRVEYTRQEKDVTEMFANVSESVGQEETKSVASTNEVSFF